MVTKGGISQLAIFRHELQKLSEVNTNCAVSRISKFNFCELSRDHGFCFHDAFRAQELRKLKEDVIILEHEGKTYLQGSLAHVSNSATLLAELIGQLCRHQFQKPQCSDASTDMIFEKAQYAEKATEIDDLLNEASSGVLFHIFMHFWSFSANEKHMLSRM